MPQDFTGEANNQHLIDTQRKRLCYKASKETREYAEDLKATICGVDKESSDVQVPNCVYRCGCPEIDGCKFWDKFVKWCRGFTGGIDIRTCDIQTRYDFYNDWFYSEYYKRKDG